MVPPRVRSDMWLPLAGIAALGVVALAAGVVRSRDARRRSGHVDALLASAAAPTTPVDFHRDLADLPDPVRRYFETVLTDGQERVRTARVEQTGEFRLGDREAPWRPFTATEWFAVDPPGFVWSAAISLAPLVRVRVVDRFQHGRGALRARLFSLVTVADADAGPELDEGELSRYLAESVWVPTALLPAAGVDWTPVDDRSAEATLSHEGTTVSLTFRFGDDGLVERVHASDRPREVDGEYVPTPWTGTFGDYRDVGGVRVPTSGEVAWELPDGDLPYWRADIDVSPTLGDAPAQRR